MKTIIVLSGGMDSAVALAFVKEKIGREVAGAVHFQYGSKHNANELIAAQLVAEHYYIPTHVIALPFVNQLFKSDLLNSGGDVPDGHYEDISMKRTVVPFRNGIMLSIAAGLAESLKVDFITIGNHAGDHAIYPDCRAAFVGPMAQAIKHGTYRKIELLSPFVSMTKSDIAKMGHELDVPFHLTWSCYKGGERHCGTCGTCVERIEAFALAGVNDPTEYERQL